MFTAERAESSMTRLTESTDAASRIMYIERVVKDDNDAGMARRRVLICKNHLVDFRGVYDGRNGIGNLSHGVTTLVAKLAGIV